MATLRFIPTRRVEPESHAVAGDVRVGGSWLLLARLAWAAVAAGVLTLCAAAIPSMLHQMDSPPPEVRQALDRHGVAVGTYAVYMTALSIVFALGNFVIACLIVRRRSSAAMALVASVFLVLLGGANPGVTSALVLEHPRWAPATISAQFLEWAAVILVLFLFPNGRIVPWWARWPVIAWPVGLLAAQLGGGSITVPAGPWIAPLLLGGLVAGSASQVYRHLRASGLVQRQQTKWVVCGLVAAIVSQVWVLLPEPFFFGLGPRGSPYDPVGITVLNLTFFLIPLTIGIAILRYHLWDIDVLINRALVYGALTVSVIGLYALVVAGVGVLIPFGERPLSLITTGLIAVLFQPLRERLQRAVNHLLYGKRDEPYAVLSQLGQRLEGTLAHDAILPTIVETVAEALKLPFAAIALRQGEEGPPVVVTAYGSPVDAPVTLPLRYRDETVGSLLLAPRAPGEAFTAADLRLLDDLARQAGVAVHAVRLTADLQRSRELLVAAREEERRRLRRDLHDGLGPQLASQTLTLDAARKLMPRDPATADASLDDLRGHIQAAVADIRRLVYALRPPALDDLGLAFAVRQVASDYQRAGLAIAVEAPDALPPLPAAVELAAYRIAQEALTNVVRHAAATVCTIRLAVDPQTATLHVSVVDNGAGLPSNLRPGVGLASIRERATELGGTCAMESDPRGGTRILVSLPLPKET